MADQMVEDNMKKALVQKQEAELEDSSTAVPPAGAASGPQAQPPTAFVPPVANPQVFVQPMYQAPAPQAPLHGQWKDCLCDCCNGGCASWCMAVWFPCCGPCILSKINSRINWNLGWTSMGRTPFQQWLKVLTIVNVVWWIGICFYEFYAAMAWEQMLEDFNETHYDPCMGYRRGLIGTVVNSVVETANGRRSGNTCYDIQHTTECNGNVCHTWECDLDGCKEWTYDSYDGPSGWDDHGVPVWNEGGAHQYTFEAHSPAFQRSVQLFQTAQAFEWVTTLCNAIFTILIVIARSKVRQQYLIPASCEEYGGRTTCCGLTEDIACACFCTSCTIAQMARHVGASPNDQCDPCVDPGPAPAVPTYNPYAPNIAPPAAPNGMALPGQPVEVGQLIRPGPNNV